MLRPAVTIARATGAVSRISRQGGGTSLPGKLLLRLEPKAIAELGAQLERGSVVLSATNGKTTTARMIATVLGQAGVETVHNRARANMPGGVATALLQAAPRGRIAGSRLPLSGRRGVARNRRVGTGAAHGRARQSVSRSARPVRRARAARRRVGDGRRAHGGARRVRAERGRSHGGRPRARRRGTRARARHLLRGQRPLPGVAPARARFRRQALPPLRIDVRVRGRLSGSPRRLRLPELRQPPADPLGSRHPGRAARHVGRARVHRHPQGRPRAGPAPPRPLQRLQRARGDRLFLELGIAPETIARGLESSAAAFGRAERIDIRGRELAILLIKNPAGANEVFRTLRSGGETELDLWITLNDGIADGRDISWIWDADFELLAGVARRITCSGTRAEELALRLKYAGLDGLQVDLAPGLEDGLDRALAAGDGRPLYALPTYTALLALQELLAARGHARPFWE